MRKSYFERVLESQGVGYVNELLSRDYFYHDLVTKHYGLNIFTEGMFRGLLTKSVGNFVWWTDAKYQGWTLDKGSKQALAERCYPLYDKWEKSDKNMTKFVYTWNDVITSDTKRENMIYFIAYLTGFMFSDYYIYFDSLHDTAVEKGLIPDGTKELFQELFQKIEESKKQPNPFYARLAFSADDEIVEEWNEIEFGWQTKRTETEMLYLL